MNLWERISIFGMWRVARRMATRCAAYSGLILSGACPGKDRGRRMIRWYAAAFQAFASTTDSGSNSRTSAFLSADFQFLSHVLKQSEKYSCRNSDGSDVLICRR